MTRSLPISNGAPVRTLVYGASTFGILLREQVELCGLEFAGFVDDTNVSPEILGPLEAIRGQFTPAHYSIVIAIGYRDIPARRSVFARLAELGYACPSLIHPSAVVSRHARIGEGVVIMAGALVDMRTSIGDLCVLWPGAVISHDTVLIGNTFVSPNATVCGLCTVGRDSFLGAGSTVADNTHVPEGHFLKANAVFASDRMASLSPEKA